MVSSSYSPLSFLFFKFIHCDSALNVSSFPYLFQPCCIKLFKSTLKHYAYPVNLNVMPRAPLQGSIFGELGMTYPSYYSPSAVHYRTVKKHFWRGERIIKINKIKKKHHTHPKTKRNKNQTILR